MTNVPRVIQEFSSWAAGGDIYERKPADEASTSELFKNPRNENAVSELVRWPQLGYK